MTLDDYLTTNKISGPKFAQRIKVDPATIYRIRRGYVVPHRETMQAIITASGGDISVEDLVQLDQPTKKET